MPQCPLHIHNPSSCNLSILLTIIPFTPQLSHAFAHLTKTTTLSLGVGAATVGVVSATML